MIGLALSLLTLSFPTRTLSTLSFATLVNSALSLMALCSSSTSGPFANSDSTMTSFQIRRGLLPIWISKETFSPLFLVGSDRGWSLH